MSKTHVDLKWEAPKNDGGRPILRYANTRKCLESICVDHVAPTVPLNSVYIKTFRYVIEKKEKLGTRWVKSGKTSGPDCKYRVTDVIEGTEVQFQVLAENEAGVGHPSEPTDIVVIEDPTGMLRIFYKISVEFPISELNIPVQNICNFWIKSIFYIFPGPPSPPQDLHVTEAARDHVSIAWKAPERNGGSPVTGYHIELCEAGTEKWMRINSRPVKELKYRAGEEEGIVPEKKYIFRVRAVNSIGASEPSDISESVYAKDSDCKLNAFHVFY